MNDILRHLVEYIDEVAGQAIQPRLAPEASGKLPVYIGQMVDVFETGLFGRACHLLVFKKNDLPSPVELANLHEVVRKALGGDVVFVFPKLKSFERRRLVQHRVPFIVPRQQIYLPWALVDLRESTRTRLQGPDPSTDLLSASAQVLLLTYLQKDKGADWPLNQWAEVLPYSAMTISRACKELSAAGLCDPEKRGRNVILRLNPDRHALWESARSHLRSPVLHVSPVRISKNRDIRFFDAGLSALSRLSLISEDSRSVQAISDSAYRAAREDRKIEEQPFAESGMVMLERWRYAPSLLSSDGRMVDRLSLYLSLRDDPDERVQGALEEMLEGVKW